VQILCLVVIPNCVILHVLCFYCIWRINDDDDDDYGAIKINAMLRTTCALGLHISYFGQLVNMFIKISDYEWLILRLIHVYANSSSYRKALTRVAATTVFIL